MAKVSIALTFGFPLDFSFGAGSPLTRFFQPCRRGRVLGSVSSPLASDASM